MNTRSAIRKARRLKAQTEHPGMVFSVAGEQARLLGEWSRKSFESKKPFGCARPRF